MSPVEENGTPLARLHDVLSIADYDPKVVQLVEETIVSASEYVGRIVRLEAFQRLRFRPSENPISLKAELEALDDSRTNAHNALLANLEAANRYLFKNFDGVPEGGLCVAEPSVLSVNKRKAVRDWAIQLVAELADHGR